MCFKVHEIFIHLEKNFLYAYMREKGYLNLLEISELLNWGRADLTWPQGQSKKPRNFYQNTPTRGKNAEHGGVIIFKPKFSKTYEFSQFLNKATFLTFIDFIRF